jgi:hypothetical protein
MNNLYTIILPIFLVILILFFTWYPKPVGGIVLLIKSFVLIWNPKIFMPTNYSYSGDFWASEYGLRTISTYITGFCLFLLGCYIILSIKKSENA